MSLVVLGGLLALFTAVCGVQILIQVWAPETTTTDVECDDGVRQLITAVHRARAAAAVVTDDERQALAKFRRALQPEWGWRPHLGDRCSDLEVKRALVLVDRLRYAEEHAVRYESADLADLRRRIAALDSAKAPAR